MFNLQFTIILSFIALLYLLSARLPVYAQYDQITNIPASATCDLCGRCQDAVGGSQQPPDWGGCRRCLYQHPSIPNSDQAATDPTSSEFVNFHPVQNKTWTPIGCIDFDVASPGGFVNTLLRFVIGIAGGLAFLGFLWGGFQMVTSSGDPGRLTSGRSMILASLGALLLIIFSTFLLRFIGFDILRLPGFGG